MSRHPLPYKVAHSGEHGTELGGLPWTSKVRVRVVLPNTCHGESGEIRHKKVLASTTWEAKGQR